MRIEIGTVLDLFYSSPRLADGGAEKWSCSVFDYQDPRRGALVVWENVERRQTKNIGTWAVAVDEGGS